MPKPKKGPRLGSNPAHQKPKYAHLPNAETEYDHALSTIRSAMAELMWDTHSGDHELNVRLSGYPEYYYSVLQLRLQQVTQKAAAEPD